MRVGALKLGSFFDEKKFDFVKMVFESLFNLIARFMAVSKTSLEI